MILRRNYSLHREALIAERALGVAAAPDQDALAVEVVTWVAGKRDDWLAWLEAIYAEGALAV